MKTYSVYLLASGKHGTLYIGVTSDLAKRVWEHRTKRIKGFTAKYGVTRLVWHEAFEDVDEAIAREKRLKKWRRAWKIRLIEEHNRDWNDLYPSLFGLTAKEFERYEDQFPEGRPQ
ncbi:GIY-YIG nuclease family protein [Parvularcula marina]|uniref:GIY-YIG nuclease family protein n=1 Tax=Parvularcula marina TaxID=2292771 RepID=A0A371RIJ9_9PROT|nr:GIY-YIG nuclease family protein [Parvularcula marina]RFB05279.1 GIY-YIG nuclease family protein [Parvularcula marina]